MQTTSQAYNQTDALGVALAEIAEADHPSSPATQADLARAAIALLAEDPKTRAELELLAKGPAPRAFGMIEATGLVTAALLVLQTHVRFERDKQGRWSFHIEKKPADMKLLRTLADRLLKLLP
ncbi:MAG: hypothetical protein HC872_07915 [Gammaproteobacteria bacterium]|nr:hypothetical protein [Gammaproteobacteria bacterium]